MILLLLFGLSLLVAVGIGLAFVSLSRRAPAQVPSAGFTALGGAFEAVAEQVTARQAKRGNVTLPERLARAGLRLKPSEYVMLQAASALALAALCVLRFGLNPLALLFGALGLLVPGLYLRFRTRRRMKRLNEQLVDVLNLMANSLRAGHSLPQTLSLISQDAPSPISDEFSRSVRELQVGGSAEVALANLARRAGSDDLDLMVTAMLIQIKVGGNLAETLDRIAGTIRERVRVKGEISAATAQGRMSGWIITLLPVGLAVALFLIEPSYFRPMLGTPLGWAMLVGAGVLILIGNLLIRQVVKIDV